MQSFLHIILYHPRQDLPEPNFLMLYTDSGIIGGIIFPEKDLGSTASFFFFACKQPVHQSDMYYNSPGSQQCIVTISCDSGWTGIPDVRYDEAGTSGEGGGGGDDDEDDISFLGLFLVSYISCL